ncbi:MAG: hypothetical protein K2Q06_08030, partial [Parvularculaceae bacterium]|nr:hypothetical protein [Parvularculaceae bacterium]
PMRAALLLVSLFLAAGAAPAEARGSRALDAALACRGIEDPMTRLACFDAALAPAGAADTVAAAQYGPDAASAAPADPVASFGAEQVKRIRDAEPQVEQIESAVTSIKIDRFGKATVTLANGQVWTQLMSDPASLLPNSKKSYTAVIRRASLGSYFLRINEMRQQFRAKRVD